MQELSKEENNKEFSQLCHDYYKLATMRVMQAMREKHQVPPEDVPSLTISIFGRMLNESCYAVGAQLKSGYKITDIFSKEHLLTLVRVLNGEHLDQLARKDIDTDIKSGLAKFKQFILDIEGLSYERTICTIAGKGREHVESNKKHRLQT